MRLEQAHSLTNAEEIKAMWDTNLNSSKIIRALAANPHISRENRAAVIQKITDLTQGEIGFGRMDRARGAAEGLAKNPALEEDEIDELIASVAHLDQVSHYESLKLPPNVQRSQFHRCQTVWHAVMVGLAFNQPNTPPAQRAEILRDYLSTIVVPEFDEEKRLATRNDLRRQFYGIKWAAHSPLQDTPRSQLLDALRDYPSMGEAAEWLRGTVKNGAVKHTYLDLNRPDHKPLPWRQNGPPTKFVASTARDIAREMGMRRTRKICAEILGE